MPIQRRRSAFSEREAGGSVRLERASSVGRGKCPAQEVSGAGGPLIGGGNTPAPSAGGAGRGSSL
jgi:hypothetical protein